MRRRRSGRTRVDDGTRRSHTRVDDGATRRLGGLQLAARPDAARPRDEHGHHDLRIPDPGRGFERAARGPSPVLQPGPRDRRPSAEDARAPRRIPGFIQRRLPEARVPLAGELLHARRQEGDRPGGDRRHVRPRARTVDGLPGGVVDGARLPGGVRTARQRPLHLAAPVRAVLPALLRLPPAAVAAAPRPARAAVVLGVARLLQPRRDLQIGAARLPAAAVPARAHAGAAAPPPPAAAPLAAARARLLAGDRGGVPRRLPRRAERHRWQRHRRRLCGCHRRRADNGGPPALRLLPERQRTRGHVRARQLRGVRALPADLRLERHLGRPPRRPRGGGLLRPRSRRR